MNERKKINIQLLKNTSINFILYAIIFTIFAALLYMQVNYYLYKTADSDLEKSRIEWITEKKKQEKIKNNIIGIEEQSNYQATNLGISNINIIAIERGEDGSINTNSLINSSYLKYFEDIKFNESTLNQIYEVSINNKYYYRAINAKYRDDSDNTYYVQLLINVDSEKAMMKVFSNTLILGFSVIIVTILILTYILNRRAMDPIIKNYEKQTEFVQNASHELRTPLTIIQAKQEMLLRSPNSKIIEKSEDIAQTLNETRRIIKLVKELMDLARADASKENVNKNSEDLNEIIKEVVGPYIELSEMQNKKINLKLDCTRECNVDRSKIKQLLVILLDNALKYTEENDEIIICTRNRDDKCFIEVKDTGIGISDEGMKHIFERFYREDKARSRENGGSGLGLSIAKTIVNMHGGSIKVSHNKPKGTIFIIKL